MSTLAEQVELLKQWYPLENFDKAVPNLTDQEKRLTGFLYVALARIQELETDIGVMKKKRAELAPEPVSTFLDSAQAVTSNIPPEEPPEPGRPERLYRGRGWMQVKEPASFNKYRADGKASEQS